MNNKYSIDKLIFEWISRSTTSFPGGMRIPSLEWIDDKIKSFLR
jgi:hypothetical protein